MATTTATTTRASRVRRAGFDHLTAAMLSLAAFLAVLALLAWQLRSGAASRPRPVVVLRRVYETRVVETLVGAPGPASSSSQSVSTSAVSSPGAAPVTRTS